MIFHLFQQIGYRFVSVTMIASFNCFYDLLLIHVLKDMWCVDEDADRTADCDQEKYEEHKSVDH